MSPYSTGAIVPERDRCICHGMGLCIDHCRACNHSGRDLEECCIADPDWLPDEDDLARRMDANGFRAELRDRLDRCDDYDHGAAFGWLADNHPDLVNEALDETGAPS